MRAGLTGKQLAERTGWQPSKVSRLENGRQMPAVTDLNAWTRACGAGEADTEELLRLLGDIQVIHRDWKRRMRRGQAAVQASYNDLARRSRLVRHFETAFVPGLLQTPPYARRVLTEMVTLHGLDVDDVDAAVANRMWRQELLYDTTMRFEFLLAEPVLRWRLCPAEVMRGQLDRLQAVIGLANVRFGIMPMDSDLVTTPQNAFQLYDDIAVVETFIGESIHRDAEAKAYARVFDLLWEQAVSGQSAQRLIVRAADELDGTA
jgi:transcriptional regulator with XRE-family HTH domain